MKQKKKAILASLALIAIVAMAIPAAAQGDHELAAENNPFWTIFAQVDHPGDTGDCITAATNYVDSLGLTDMNQYNGEISSFTQMCTEVANMPATMQSEMAANGVTSNLFDNTTDWHNVTGLYFQKEGIGRIEFSKTIDFMSYRFMTFMSNFRNMVQFSNGYISFNASMIPDMINYGATLTMYGLDFDQIPDIYVTAPGGSTMRKANASDLGNISYNAATGELSFTPKHFSAFKAVAKGTKIKKKMKISSVKPKTVKYNAAKDTFKITVKGTSLYSASGLTCMLGFNSASEVKSNKRGKRITCTFDMSDFSVKKWYPLTVTALGVGEVKKTNGVKIK